MLPQVLRANAKRQEMSERLCALLEEFRPVAMEIAFLEKAHNPDAAANQVMRELLEAYIVQFEDNHGTDSYGPSARDEDTDPGIE